MKAQNLSLLLSAPFLFQAYHATAEETLPLLPRGPLVEVSSAHESMFLHLGKLGLMAEGPNGLQVFETRGWVTLLGTETVQNKKRTSQYGLRVRLEEGYGEPRLKIEASGIVLCAVAEFKPFGYAGAPLENYYEDALHVRKWHYIAKVWEGATQTQHVTIAGGHNAEQLAGIDLGFSGDADGRKAFANKLYDVLTEAYKSSYRNWRGAGSSAHPTDATFHLGGLSYDFTDLIAADEATAKAATKEKGLLRAVKHALGIHKTLKPKSPQHSEKLVQTIESSIAALDNYMQPFLNGEQPCADKFSFASEFPWQGEEPFRRLTAEEFDTGPETLRSTAALYTVESFERVDSESKQTINFLRIYPNPRQGYYQSVAFGVHWLDVTGQGGDTAEALANAWSSFQSTHPEALEKN